MKNRQNLEISENREKLKKSRIFTFFRKNENFCFSVKIQADLLPSAPFRPALWGCLL